MHYSLIMLTGDFRSRATIPPKEVEGNAALLLQAVQLGDVNLDGFHDCFKVVNYAQHELDLSVRNAAACVQAMEQKYGAQLAASGYR
jgi:hypothetical protein